MRQTEHLMFDYGPVANGNFTSKKTSVCIADGAGRPDDTVQVSVAAAYEN